MAKKKKTVKRSNTKIKSEKVLKFTLGRIVTLVIIFVVIAFFLFNNFLINHEPEVKYYTFKKEGELTFTDSLGNSKIKIDLEIADNDYERQLGLMNRKSMEETQGMLFIFPFERTQSFWMRNTLISLDMMFINKDKKIVTIHKNTEVLSGQSYPSKEPALYVVEVVSGFTDKYNIVVGDKIFWISTIL